MKLVIVEGCDRVGKDTLVNRLTCDNSNVIKRHWSFPKGTTNEEKTLYQKNSFYFEKNFYQQCSSYQDLKSIMIWNRSHLGEFVYGSIYRDSKPHTWVWDYEKELISNSNISDIYLILLYADANFIVQQDDGQSYSSKLEMKEKEINIFIDTFNQSSISNKLMIKVNDKENYIDKEIIYTQVKKFINENA